MYYNLKYFKNNYFLILEFLFIFFLFFPYIKIFGYGFSTDTQPFFTLFALIILLLKIKKLEIPTNFILLLPIIMFLFLYFVFFFIKEINQNSINNLLSGDNFKFLRFFFNYLSFPLIYLACVQLKFSKKKISIFFYFAVVIWFLVALIQKYIDPTFLQNLLDFPRGMNAASRGVNSLAPEPSIFTVQSVFLLLISLSLKTHFLSLIILIQGVVLSKSGTSLFLVLIFGIYFVKFFFESYYKIFLTLLITFIILVLNLNQNENLNKFLEKQPSRAAKILLDLNSNQKLEISKFDASIRARYESINHGIEGFVHNNFLPNGVFNEVVRTYLYNPNRPLYEESQNIMSCIFLMLFEIGFLTVFFIFFVFNNINKYFNSLNDKIFFSIVSLIALVLPISPALPLFALLNAIWQNKKI